MSAPREWRIVERFGRFYVECQYGGFAGWHNDRESAIRQGRQYVEDNPGDTFPEGGAKTELRTMNQGTPREFVRVFLFCPDGHECVSAPVESGTGRRLTAGDYSREFCGYGPCNWHRHVWDSSWVESEACASDRRSA